MMNVKHPVLVVVAMLLMLSGLVIARDLLNSDTSSQALQRGHYRQALVHLRNDAAGGDVAAVTMLGNLHHLGLGVPRRPDKSVVFYSEAAFAGDVASRVNLGHAYSHGQGVVEDAAMAYAWYNLARNSGSEVAQSYMSELLREHRMRHHKVIEVKRQYATIKNFTKLH